jgi:hypothetical protein
MANKFDKTITKATLGDQDTVEGIAASKDW